MRIQSVLALATITVAVGMTAFAPGARAELIRIELDGLEGTYRKFPEIPIETRISSPIGAGLRFESIDAIFLELSTGTTSKTSCTQNCSILTLGTIFYIRISSPTGAVSSAIAEPESDSIVLERLLPRGGWTNLPLPGTDPDNLQPEGGSLVFDLPNFLLEGPYQVEVGAGGFFDDSVVATFGGELRDAALIIDGTLVPEPSLAPVLVVLAFLRLRSVH